MAGCDQWALLKLFEVILCIGCLSYKWWTDEEASRLYFFLEKRSREWPLQNNVTWNQAGSWFADVVFGGYAIITIGFFVAHFMGELRHTRKTETFLLGIGALLFFGAGCMIITSFDNVPEGLIDNALILGFLAIFTGFIFTIDICCLRSRIQTSKQGRQEKQSRMKRDATIGQKNSLVVEQVQVTESADKPVQEKVISELRSSIKKRNTEVNHRIENEQKQTRANLQTRAPTSAENDEDGRVSTDSGSDSSDYDATLRYNRKSRGSQTKRKHFLKETKQQLVVVRDAETTTDSPTHVVKSTFVNGVLQSSKISTTDPQKSDSPSTSEESYKIQPADTAPSYLVSGGKKLQPDVLTSPHGTTNENSTSMPSSPTDPGYVLHTASKWPNANPLKSAPTYQKWKESRNVKSVQQSVV